MHGEMKGQSPGEAYNRVRLIHGILRYFSNKGLKRCRDTFRQVLGTVKKVVKQFLTAFCLQFLVSL